MLELLVRFHKKKGLIVKIKGPWPIVLAYPALVSIIQSLANLLQ